MQHIPKGGMCRTCARRDQHCGDLPFSKMPIISTCKDVAIVRCAQYQRAEKEVSP